jgi:hypothetical protein
MSTSDTKRKSSECRSSTPGRVMPTADESAARWTYALIAIFAPITRNAIECRIETSTITMTT